MISYTLSTITCIMSFITKIIIGTVTLLGAGTLYQHRMKSRHVHPEIIPEGRTAGLTTLALGMVPKVLQCHEPVKGHDIHVVGFHPMKDSHCHQMEAHHFCKRVNEDFWQCLLFDGNTADANLTGLEYIVSEQLFEKLPPEEQQFWHPHNYEILSGQLTAPGIPSTLENIMLKSLVNSYGKTFHTWRAKCWEGEKPYQDRLPMGDALLAWSFNHDGETKDGLIEERDARLGVRTEEKKEARKGMERYMKKQKGEDHFLKKEEIVKSPEPQENHMVEVEKINIVE